MRNIFTTYIDVISYTKDANNRVGIETEENEAEQDMLMDDVEVEDREDHQEFVNFTEIEIRKFKEFANQPNVYERLSDVFAPAIWEHNDVKKGCLL